VRAESLAGTGRLIVFEGTEGCGKSTQLQLTANWLRAAGRTVTTTREPGGTALGAHLRQSILKADRLDPVPRAELLLYAADRAQHVETFLRPHLARGAVVLCDRFTASTVAYQGYGRGLDLDLIDRLAAIATGGLRPDVTLWLDLDLETALARMRARGELDRIERSDRAFHERVCRGYAALAASDPAIVKIDASGSPERVQAQIRAALASVLAA